MLNFLSELAMSSTGSIAHIVETGRKIEFTALSRDTKTGHWDLTEPSKTPSIAPAGRSFKHIQFSGIGIDLAVADDLGLVHIYTIQAPLGRMVPAAHAIPSNEGERGDLDAVVGLHWLPTYPTEFRVSVT
jgi:mediator of RNA polymerase II transcription subunit 16, fungi type